MDITSQQREVSQRLGLAVIESQNIERILRICCTFVIGPHESMTYEAVVAYEAKTAKATLGRFIDALKERAKISDEFQKVLERYLILRNDLIHDTSRIEGWSLTTPAGLEVALATLIEFSKLGSEVCLTLLALVRAWEHQLGRVLYPEVDNEFFRSIDSDRVPTIASVIEPLKR